MASSSSALDTTKLKTEYEPGTVFLDPKAILRPRSQEDRTAAIPPTSPVALHAIKAEAGTSAIQYPPEPEPKQDIREGPSENAQAKGDGPRADEPNDIDGASEKDNNAKHLRRMVNGSQLIEIDSDDSSEEEEDASEISEDDEDTFDDDEDDDDEMGDQESAHNQTERELSYFEYGQPRISATDRLSKLPKEVERLILAYLDREPFTIFSLMSTSRHWYHKLNSGLLAELDWKRRCLVINPKRTTYYRGYATWRRTYIVLLKTHCMNCLEKKTSAKFGEIWPEGPHWAVVCRACQKSVPYFQCINGRDARRLGVSVNQLETLPRKRRAGGRGWKRFDYLWRTIKLIIPAASARARELRLEKKARWAATASTSKMKKKKQAAAARQLNAKKVGLRKRKEDRLAKKDLDAANREAKLVHKANLAAAKKFGKALTNDKLEKELSSKFKGDQDALGAILASSLASTSGLLSNRLESLREGKIKISSASANDLVDLYVDLQEQIQITCEELGHSIGTDRVRRQLFYRCPTTSLRRSHSTDARMTWLDALASKAASFSQFKDTLKAYTKGVQPTQAQMLQERKQQGAKRGNHETEVSGRDITAQVKKTTRERRPVCQGNQATCVQQPSLKCPNGMCGTHCPGCTRHSGNNINNNNR